MSIFPTPIPQIQVIVHRRNGDVEVEAFHTEQEARAFCREEVKWESTKYVACQELNLILPGDFNFTAYA